MDGHETVITYTRLVDGKPRVQTMADAVELRRKAALYRRIARIPTSGGGPADRVLLHLADRLDEEAAAAERLAGSNSPESKRPLC